MDEIYHINKAFIENNLILDGFRLFQVGRMYCGKNTVIPNHIHPYLYELTVVTDGKGSVYTNDVPAQVKKGDIYFSHPSDLHRIESDEAAPLKFDFFAFSCDAEPLRRELDAIANAFHSPQKRVFRDESIPHTVAAVLAEVCDEQLHSKDLLRALVQQIVIHIIRAFSLPKPAASPDAATDGETLCYRLMHYIDTHIYTMKNLQELSEVYGYSYGYLSALFKKTTASTLSAYHSSKKLEIARRLILEDRLKITEISERLNYASVYAFSKAFSHRYGLSPRNYLKANPDADSETYSVFF